MITQPVWPARVQSGVVRKVPPLAWPAGTSTLKPSSSAESIRAGLGLALDLLLDQADQVDRALAVADQHERAAMIVVREIVAPGGKHVGISEIEEGHRVLPHHRAAMLPIVAWR